MDQYYMGIVDNREVAIGIYKLVIEPISINKYSTKVEISSVSPLPGQYFHVRVSYTNDPLLRRPISIHDYNPNNKQISLIYRVVGEGTKLLSEKKPKEIIDVFGPLGNGFTYNNLKENPNILLIGGGIGTPPLYYLAKKLTENGFYITTLLGFQSKSDAILIDEFLSFGDVRVSTIDGSIGVKGTVLDLINDEEKWDIFYACGPVGMLKAIQKKWFNTDMIGYLSLEERMGCGVGACYGCIVNVDKSIYKEGYKKVCSDGPVFPFREVIL